MAAPTNEDVCELSYNYLYSPGLLKGKTAFITGGGSGICFTIAEIFLRHGCKVAIASRNMTRLESASAKLHHATGGTCLPIKMDVRKPEEIISAVDQATSQLGAIDILVNGAAGNFLSPITGLSFNAYRTVLEIDTMGTFNTSKIVYEKCMRDHGGVIINITATIQYRGQILQAHAGSAKAAIDALTKHMAVEWGPNSVRVVGVAPGPIANTEGITRLAGDYADLIASTIPLQRMGTRLEIAHVVLFLSSEAASLISGDTLVADGGAWLTSAPKLRLRDSKL